ncbi:MAG: 16S rRNA (cytosine(967)-C(5))-methyltransferase RsmB [candidate division Zixibacteria bacterium]|nr:16S rRNA (cytosine(967)-C(5))-methyltransferase RsmB [candidate division Zixibacteria bacterium]
MTNEKQNKSSLNYDPVRAAAIEALILIEQGQQVDSAVFDVISGREFRPVDRRFLLQLVNGTTKMRRRLDHEIRFYLARPSTELPLKLSNILRLGLYQLRYTDRIPDAAAVSESVNLANFMTDRSRARLVNAVLRASLREPEKVKYISPKEDPVRYLGDYYSYPDYFVEYCLKEFGFDRTAKFLDAYNQSPQLTYRVNHLRSKPDDVARILKEGGVDFSFGKHLPEFIHIKGGGLPLEEKLIRTGKVYVQDESAGLAVRLLNPRPGSDVVDLTAAPGGKTTYMAVRMRNRGRVTAVDKSHVRLRILEKNVHRLGIKIISPVVSDMMDFNGGPYDRVLLDPPCSGWGTAGKNSDLRWVKTINDVRNLVRIQKRMIDAAAKLVKPGGVMVYSTCTIIRDENDQVVEEFLLRNRDFDVEPAGQYFDGDIVSERGFVKTYPYIDELDGAFCARLIRKLH